LGQASAAPPAQDARSLSSVAHLWYGPIQLSDRVRAMNARLRHSLSLLGCSAALLLGACAKDIVTHGYQVDQHRLAMIEPGVTSREEVARLLGTPSSIAPFDDQTW